jgi:hypothetical protein
MRRPEWVGATEDVEKKVRGPATALLVMGIIGLVLQMISFLINVTGVLTGPGFGPAGPGMGPSGSDLAYQAVMTVVGLAYNGYIVWASREMKGLRRYGHALAASIMSIIPCFSPCCLISMPFGIWALVVLANREVKEAFQ